jgi:4-hydroxy-tetrahydrodipicolinate reductase
MKIALLGYGKMGKAIEALLPEFGHEVFRTFNSLEKPTAALLQGADVAIEFSTPHTCKDHILACFEAGVPVVVGTTAWYDQYDEVVAAMNENNALLAATNFSIGVQITFHLNRELARIMSNFPEYQASIEEIHHTAKLDKPSGTAISLAEGVLGEHPAYDRWDLKENKTSEATELPIQALRLPDVPGTHFVRYESDVDVIELSHEAKNRKGFAAGAIRAASFLHNKKGVFTMKDLLNL